METVADLASGPATAPDAPVVAQGHARSGRSWAARRVFVAQPKSGRRISIRFKAFALLLAQSLFVVVGFAVLIAWAFNQGFSRYMTSQDDLAAHAFAKILEAEYAKTGNWEALAQDTARWAQLAMTAAGHKVADAGKLQQIFQQFDTSEFPESIPAPLPLRFVLFDTGKRLVSGKVPPGASIRETEIMHAGQVVGTLGFVISHQSIYDIQFRQRLQTALGVIFLVSVLLATLAALIISRFVTRSVGNIGRAARALAAGTRAAPLPVDSNDELGDLAQDFNELSSALQRNENLQRQWLAEISHELRTPLQILMAETEAVVDGMRAPSREGFKSLYDESHRLARLVEDLHKLSLLDAGIAKLQLVEVRVPDLLQSCVAAEMTRFRQRGITLSVAPVNAGDHRVFADADKLRQVFMNLLENSLRYTDSGGQVQISVDTAGDWVNVRFEDSSPGVAEEEIPRLFERLYRGESSRNRASGGAGLGLAIVQSIVETHGGTISASPSALGGLRFDIRLRKAD